MSARASRVARGRERVLMTMLAKTGALVGRANAPEVLLEPREGQRGLAIDRAVHRLRVSRVEARIEVIGCRNPICLGDPDSEYSLRWCGRL